jgi:hypothetical protein
MMRRLKHMLLPLIASLAVVTGLVAGVSASSGIQLPPWGGGEQQELTAGPLGLNPEPVSSTAPVSISIPDATVDAEVERNEIVDGIMLDPSGPWVVSWYQETGQLGEFDNAVMSGHVDYWDVGPAVFYTVGQLQQGAPMHVRGENGVTYTFQVEWVKTYDIAGLTPEAINEIVGPTDYRALTLITCGGAFDYDRGEYLSRTVIRGRLVDTEGIPSTTASAGGQTVEQAEAPAETTEQAPASLAVGGSATVNQDGVNLRADATTSADVATVLAQGQAVSIAGGPIDADGFTWWQVTLEDGTQGWIAGDFLDP